MTFSSEILRAYREDPVRAAWGILGADYDVFQRARLRTYWFTPRVIDDGGVGTAKTETLIDLWLLRATLMEGRQIYQYYQTLGAAEENFIQRIKEKIEGAPVVQSQLARQHGGKLGWASMANGYRLEFKNGASITVPAPDFVNDAKNQAGLRYHDLGVDESKEVEKFSEGLSKQLRQRATKSTPNNKHPFWTNKHVLCGHAEDPDLHPSYKRVKQYRDYIRGGRSSRSSKFAIFTCSYKDYRGAFKKYAEPIAEAHSEDVGIMSDEELAQIYFGLWSRGGVEWYSGRLVDACRHPRVSVQAARIDPAETLVCGQDTATAGSESADWTTVYVISAMPETAASFETLEARGILANASFGGVRYIVRLVWGTLVRGWSPGDISSYIHTLDHRYGFTAINMDPGGGGHAVASEMRKRRQQIEGEWRMVPPLVEAKDAHMHPDGKPTVHMFTRSPEFGALWGGNWGTDAALVNMQHHRFRNALRARKIWFPAAYEDLLAAVQGGLGGEEVRAWRSCEEAITQIKSIAVVKVGKGSEAAPKILSGGYLAFKSDGKKDAAYACIYAFVMLEVVLGAALDEGNSTAMATSGSVKRGGFAGRS